MGRQQVRVGEFTVDLHHIRWVEEELRRHTYRQQRIRLLEERVGGQTRMDILHGTPYREPGMPGSPNAGNPTLNKVASLLSQQELVHLRLLAGTVSDVYAELPELQQRVIKMFYFERRYTIDGVALELERDRKTIMHHRNLALTAFVLALIGDWAVQGSTKNGLPEPKRVS